MTTCSRVSSWDPVKWRIIWYQFEMNSVHFVTGIFWWMLFFALIPKEKKFYKKFYKTAPTSKSSTTKLVVAVELFFCCCRSFGSYYANPEKTFDQSKSHKKFYKKVLQKSSTILTTPNRGPSARAESLTRSRTKKFLVPAGYRRGMPTLCSLF